MDSRKYIILLSILFLFSIHSIASQSPSVRLYIQNDSVPLLEGIPIYIRVEIINTGNKPISMFTHPQIMAHKMFKVKVQGPYDEHAISSSMQHPNIYVSSRQIKKYVTKIQPGQKYIFWYNLSELKGVIWEGNYRVKFILDASNPWYQYVSQDTFVVSSKWLSFHVSKIPESDFRFIKLILQKENNINLQKNKDLKKYGIWKLFYFYTPDRILNYSKMCDLIHSLYFAYYIGNYMEIGAYSNKLFLLPPLAPPEMALKMALQQKRFFQNYTLVHGCDKVNDKTIEWAEYFADRGLPGSYLRSKIAECAGFFYLLKRKMKKALHYFNIAGEKYERDRKIAILIQQYSGFHE